MREQIKSLLNRQDKLGQLAVTTAIVRIYARQTLDERSSSATKEHNGKGFNSSDARLGTYFARYALGASGRIPALDPSYWDNEVKRRKAGMLSPIRLLSGEHLEKARKMAIKYVAQLVEEAQAKAKL